MLELLLVGRKPAAPVNPTDPYFTYVKLLMQFNNDATDVKGHTMTPAGSPSFVTDAHGTAVDLRTGLTYYTTPNANEFNLGTNDWTIEAIVNRITDIPTNNDCGIYYQGETAGNQQVFSFELQGNIATGAKPRLLIRGTSGTLLDLVSTSVPMTQNTWSHIAAVRQGATISLYLDGVRIGQGSIGAAVAIPWFSTYKATVGARTAGGATGVSFPGLIDAFRLTNGIARYTGSTYTVPTLFPNAYAYRFVRLNNLQTQGNSYVTITEFAVQDSASSTNWCLDAKASASADSFYAGSPPQTPPQAIDGIVDTDPGHRWTSDASVGPHWLMVDLGQQRSFDSVQLASYTGVNQDPTGFTIEGSNDGTNFTVLKTITGLALAFNTMTEVLK